MERPVDLSIIVTTHDDPVGLGATLEGIRHAFADVAYECLLATRGQDDATLIETARRMPEARQVLDDQGAGAARRTALGRARGAWLLVMDGDGRHAPKTARELYHTTVETAADLVVGSENLSGDRSPAKGDALMRRLAWATLPAVRRGRLTDPTSDLFCARREALDTSGLTSDGSALLSEIVSRSALHKVVEVPYDADAPKAPEPAPVGAARTLLRVALADPDNRRSGTFGLIQMNGVAVWLLLTVAFVELGGAHYLAAATLALQCAIISNFVWHEHITYSGRHTSRWKTRLGAYYAQSHVPAAVSFTLLVAFTELLAVHYLISALVAVHAGGAIVYGVWAIHGIPTEERIRHDIDKAATGRPVGIARPHRSAFPTNAWSGRGDVLVHVQRVDGPNATGPYRISVERIDDTDQGDVRLPGT
ncbi:MAG: GtrA family protein [Euryarchaeota archaeon]|nr:GtrA family protein [Euryarchaeota archaeon]